MRPTTRLTPLLTNLKPCISQITNECPLDLKHGPAFQLGHSVEPVHSKHADMHWANTWLPVPEDATAGCRCHCHEPLRILGPVLMPFAMRNLIFLSPDLMLNATAPGLYEVLFGL